MDVLFKLEKEHFHKKTLEQFSSWNNLQNDYQPVNVENYRPLLVTASDSSCKANDHIMG